MEGSASKVLSAVNDINWIPLPIPASSPVAAALHKYAASPSEIKETLGVVHAEGPSYPLGSPWSGILTVHEGFYDAWQRIYPQELDAIRQALRGKYAGKVKTLLVTGHSLGAGIATLDALALRHDLGDDFVKMDHIVFGSPRMWNPVAARIFDQIVANEDAGIYYVSRRERAAAVTLAHPLTSAHFTLSVTFTTPTTSSRSFPWSSRATSTLRTRFFCRTIRRLPLLAQARRTCTVP